MARQRRPRLVGLRRPVEHPAHRHRSPREAAVDLRPASSCSSPRSYLREPLKGPVRRVLMSVRDAIGPPARRAGPRRPDLDDRPRAALAADLGQGLLGHPAARVGHVHRRTEALHDRDDGDRRRPGVAAHHRAARRLAPRRRPARRPAPAGRPAGHGRAPRRAPQGRRPRRTTGSSSTSATTCPRCGPTPTGSTRSSPTSWRTPCVTATAPCSVGVMKDGSGGERHRAAQRRAPPTSACPSPTRATGSATTTCRFVFNRFWHGTAARQHRPRPLHRAGSRRGPRRPHQRRPGALRWRRLPIYPALGRAGARALDARSTAPRGLVRGTDPRWSAYPSA